MSRRPSLTGPGKGGYEVGYGRPPAHTRFRKGVSGNPAGRPRGSKNHILDRKGERMKAIILEEAYRNIQVREGERTVSLPVIRAAVRTMANKGLKGEMRSLKNFMELVSLIENERAALWREYLKTMIEYKAHWEQELERRRQLGITHLPDPVPHPDDIILDVRADMVEVNGPMTPDELPAWEDLYEIRQNAERTIAWAEGERKKNPGNPVHDEVLYRVRRRLNQLDQVLGDWPERYDRRRGRALPDN